MQLVTA
jgi:hypothetical protein